MNRRVPASMLALVVVASAQDAPKPATPQATPPTTGWRVLEKHRLGGEGSWDYVTFDPAGQRLIIARSSHVMVVDARKGEVIGDLPDTAGVHGVALAPDLGRGFTSNGRDHDATAIEAESGKVAGTIPLEGKPEAGVSDGAGHVYVNIEDKSEIVALDAAALKVLARWPIAPGEEPTGLALDPVNHRVFLVTAEVASSPPATPDRGRGRPNYVPDSFSLLVVGK